MDGNVRILPVVLLILVLGALPWRAAGGEPTSPGEAFVARLVHPERQADEVLRLFQGAAGVIRRPHSRRGRRRGRTRAWESRRRHDCPVQPRDGPGVAFARQGRDPDRPGCRDRRTRLVRRHPSRRRYGGRRDHGNAPHVSRRPAARRRREESAVARLGRSGVPLACLAGTGIVLANSRDRLERGVAGFPIGRDLGGDLDSGTVFRLDPAPLPNPPVGSLAQRRTIEALRAFGCRGVEGAAYLKDGSLVLDVSTTLAAGVPGAGPAPVRTVELEWLDALPSDGVSAMVSMVIDPDPASWDFAFAAADLVERVDPGRAGWRRFETRLNLLVMGTGLGLESDIRPHLRGVSACVLGEPDTPGRSAGGLVVLHLDEAAVARRLVEHPGRGWAALRAATPRLGPLPSGRAIGTSGSAGGRGLGWRRERPGRPQAVRSGLSAVAGRPRRRPPDRVGALWPARIWRPAGMARAAVRALADNPPVIWWGRREPGREHDLVRWAGLGDRVRSVLATWPGDAGAGGGIADSGFRIENSRLKINNGPTGG